MRRVHLGGRGLLGVLTVVALLSISMPAITAAPAFGAGNATVHLGKTITAATFSPVLNLNLTVDHPAAIPGDELTYTAVLTNAGAVLTVTGDLTASATPDSQATVASYWDYAATSSNPGTGCSTDHGQNSSQWPPLAGASANQPGYTPDTAAPIGSGLTLAVTPVAATGVTYPASGDLILGTVMAPGATARWHYRATIALTPAQATFVADPNQVKKTRNSFHLEVLPRSAPAAQPAIVDICRPGLFAVASPSASVAQPTIAITPPSGPVANFSPQPSLAPGASVTVTSGYQVPVPAAKGTGESDAAYLTRLTAIEGSALTANASAGGTSGGNPVTATATPVTTTEHLPVVAVTKGGPATTTTGTAATYSLGLSNTGGAPASTLVITDALPAGLMGSVSQVPTTLGPGAPASAQAQLPVPVAQPCGALTDTASLTWNDANHNAYGPVSSSFTTQVTGCSTATGLTLAPVTAGPNVTGTSQTVTATLVDSANHPVTGQTVAFTVTGANPATGTGVTDANGQATFTYTGHNNGTDTVQAAANSLQSNTSTVSWLTPVAAVSTTSVLGRFFAGGCGNFCHSPADTPAFSQTFPTIDFNPPGGTVPGNNTGVSVFTRPVTDITTDVGGNFTGAVVAQGNGVQAGVGNLFSFDAVFTGNYIVAAPGDITFNFYSDDGFIFGVGNGATRVGGASRNPPPSGLTPFQSYPVMGDFNGPTSPVANSITVHFPAAGAYPYEVDYDECCGGEVAITMATSASGHGVPPAGNLTITPQNVALQPVGQAVHLTVAAMDAGGTPLANLPVTMTVTGPNAQQVTGTTDGSGTAVLSYVGTAEGIDQAEVGANVSGSPAISNLVQIPWAFNVPGTSSGSPGAPPPAITAVAPADGTVVTAPIPINATFAPPPGETITAWNVTYQALDPAPPVTLASGTGTPPSPLATFDPTVLPNDTYAITVSATASGGGTQTTTTTVSVSGNLKLGRYITTFNDLSAPVNGLAVQVRRTYDSIDKSVGDFGVGWRVSVADFRTAANRQLGAGGWTEYPVSCFILCNYQFRTSAPHYVTVTFPDSHQEVFDFTPAGPGLTFIDLTSGTAAFTARPGTGTTSTLTVANPADQALAYGFDGNLYDTSHNVYNPTRFQLTTRDGQVLVLDTTTGLVSETDRAGNTLTVDSAGLHSSSGPSITFTRDGLGRITDITGPGGQNLTYGYSPAGDLVTTTDAVGSSDSFTYDAQHDLLSAMGPTGPLQALAYDASGRLTSVTDANGNTTHITNNVAGRQQTTVDAAGALTTVYSYDTLGDLTRVDQIGAAATHTTSYTYDSVGHLLSRTDPLGRTTTATYDAAGDQTSITDGKGATTNFVFDSSGDVTLVTQPDGTVSRNATYDAHGNLASVTHADGSTTHYTYDGAGNTTSITDGSGAVTTYAYDSSGHVTATTDPSGHTTTTTYDGAGNTTSITDPTGAKTSYIYDADNRLLSITNPLGQVKSFSYDATGRLASETDAGGAVTHYTYDAVGQLASATNRNGSVVTYHYSPDGQVLSEVLPTGTNSYAYDAFGRLVTATNASGSVAFTYDAGDDIVGQATSGAAQPTVGLTYGYDAAGNRTSMTSPAGTTAYASDTQGRLTSLTDPAGRVFQLGYSSDSNLTSLTRPNGVKDSFTYDEADNLLSRTATAGATTVASSVYAYDAAGQRTSLTSSGTGVATPGTTTYTYDAAHRLTAATPPNGPSASYTYDPAGNQVGPGYTYDAAGHLVSAPGLSFTSDAEGDITSRTDTGTGAVTHYQWNAVHQLSGTTYPDATTASYSYDALGRRVQVVDKGVTTRYVYDGSNVVLTYNGSNTLTSSYVNGLGADSLLEVVSGSTALYPVQDGSNSVTALTNAAGAVVEQYSYDAYGKLTATGSVSNPFTFTGREYDANSGLYYFRARYYDPSVGRFLSEDPSIGGNAYTYGLDSPTNYVDPSGGEAITESAILSLYTQQLGEARAFQKLNACLGGQLLLAALAMEGYAITPPDEGALVTNAFKNAYISLLPSQIQGVAKKVLNVGDTGTASQDGGGGWAQKVADKLKEKAIDKAKEEAEGKAADFLHLPEGSSDFIDGLIQAGDTALAVSRAADAVAAGDAATAQELIAKLCE